MVPKVFLMLLLAVGFAGAETSTVELPDAGQMAVLTAVSNQVGGKVTILAGDGKGGALISILCTDMIEMPHHWGMTKIPKDLSLPDAALLIEITGKGTRLNPARYRKAMYIRPDVHFYVGDDFTRAVEQWEQFPAASQHEYRVEMRRRGERLEFWIDGRYLYGLDLQPDWISLTLTAEEGAAISQVESSPEPESAREVPLSFAPIDVGRTRWLGEEVDSASFYDPYYKRSAYDGLPESAILRVPARHYTRLRLVCELDPAKSPDMTVRIGRYRQSWDGGGMVFGDTDVRIDPADPQGVESMEPLGENRWAVIVPIRTGDVAEYLQWEGLPDGGLDFGEPLDWFSLEFSRKLETRATINNGIFDRKPVGPVSSIQILEAILEKAPVSISVRSAEEGFVFYHQENPFLTVQVDNPSAEVLPLTCIGTLADFFGQEHRIEVSFNAEPGRSTATIPLNALPVGWYAGSFVFTSGPERIWEQPLSLSLLPPDTRQAGIDSPFGTWWFQGSHYTTREATKMLPLLQKAGFRHVTHGHHDPKDAAKGVTPEIFNRFQVTPSMLGYERRAKSAEEIEQKVRDYFAQWPNVEFAMIFHETSMPGLGIELPWELTGAQPTPFTDEQRKSFDVLVQRATTYAAAVRKAAPNARIMLGNGGTPFNLLWFREKVSRDVLDVLGMEMAVQTFHPEGQPTGWNLQSLWIAQEMRRIHGYDEVPIASCYEFDYRATAPGGLSLHDQANWYARDTLHCLAYRMPSINIGLIEDCNSSYYTSRWGSTGLLHRAPLNLPKPAYVSMATLTRLLDRATYERFLDCGTTGIYCLEFTRGNEFVYALWAGRGERELQLSFADNDGATITDSMGRTSTLGETLTISESPIYLTTTQRVTTVTPLASSHAAPALREARIAADLRQAKDWKIVPEADHDFVTYCAYKPMVSAQGSLTGTDQGLALSIGPQDDVAPIVAHHLMVEPLAPIALAGEPERIGVWVDGNANWGRIYFEIEDAAGRTWTSNGWNEEQGSWDMSDWEETTAINHDGWRFISMELPRHYASGYYQPSFRHWRCQGDNSKTVQLKYPLTFKRFHIVMRSHLVYVNQMVPARSATIRLRDLTVADSAD